MNKYEVISVVGEGAYGVVLKCRNRETGEFVAIKKFKESEDDDIVRKTTLREVKILRMLKATNIVSLREAFRRKGKLYLVFEFVQRNLLEVLEEHHGGLPADDVRRYVFQLCVAIEWCHRHAVIHRDIKPENLLINTTKVLKLCDFGFARQMPNAAAGEPTALTDYVATRWYRAPELLLGSSDYTFAVDQWAIGCIMGELTDGNPLFPGDTEIDQLYIIQQCLGPLTSAQMEMFLKNPRFSGLKFPEMKRGQTIHQKYGDKLSKVALHFMRSLLYMDPAKRLSSRECLDHAWFAGLKEEYGIPELSPCPTNKDLGWSLVGGTAPSCLPLSTPAVQQEPLPSPPVQASVLSRHLSKSGDDSHQVPEMMDNRFMDAFSPARSVPNEPGLDGPHYSRDSPAKVVAEAESARWDGSEGPMLGHGYHHDSGMGIKAKLMAMDASKPSGDSDHDLLVVLPGSQRPGGDDVDSAYSGGHGMKETGTARASEQSRGTMPASLIGLQSKVKPVVAQPLAGGSKIMRRTSPLQPTMVQLTAERPVTRGSVVTKPVQPQVAKSVFGTGLIGKSTAAASHHHYDMETKEQGVEWGAGGDWEGKTDASDSKAADGHEAGKNPALVKAKPTQPVTQQKSIMGKPTVTMSKTNQTASLGVPARTTTVAQPPLHITANKERESNSRTGTRSRARAPLERGASDRDSVHRADEASDRYDFGRTNRSSLTNGVAASHAATSHASPKHDGAAVKLTLAARARLAADPKRNVRPLDRDGKEAEVEEDLPIPTTAVAHVHLHARQAVLEGSDAADSHHSDVLRPTSQGTVLAGAGSAVPTMKWTKRAGPLAVTMGSLTTGTALSPRSTSITSAATAYSSVIDSAAPIPGSHAYSNTLAPMASPLVSTSHMRPAPSLSFASGIGNSSLNAPASRIRSLAPAAQPQRVPISSWAR